MLMPDPSTLFGAMEPTPAQMAAARAAALRGAAYVRPGTQAEQAAPASIGPSAALSQQMALAEALRRQPEDTGAYDLFNSGDEAAVRQQAVSRNQSLLKQRAAGQLGVLTGDRVLSQFGGAQLQGADQQEDLIANAGQFRAGQVLKAALAAEEAKRAKAKQEHDDVEREKDRQAQRQAAAIQSGDKFLLAQLEAERRERERREAAERGTEIPDLDVAPGAAPTPDDAKKVKASMAGAARLKKYIHELRDLYKKHGTELTGSVATRMGQLATAINLEAKTVAELGALAGPDLALIQSLTASDPTSVKAALKEVVGMDSTSTALDGVEKWADDAVQANMATYGYRPKGQPGRAARTTPDQALPTGEDGNPTLEEPPQAAPAGGAPKLKVPPGKKAVDVMKEGETRRINMGNGQYRTMVKRNGKLIVVEGE